MTPCRSGRLDGQPPTAFVLSLGGGLALWNNVVHPLIPSSEGAAYVPLNLPATAGLLMASRAQGLSWEELGLGPEHALRGLRWGGAIAGVVAGGLAVAVATPRLRPVLRDARVRGIGPGAMLARALVRVPLGTVLLEEVAFRGALHAALRRRWGARAAAVGSSVVFGLWHIRPTVQTMRLNDAVGRRGRSATTLGGAVVLTALGGLGFCALRERTGSLAAPAAVHVATNSLGTVASWAAHRLG